MSERPNPLAALLIRGIDFYRTAISPRRPATCRYSPTCSEYAVTAIRERGAITGSGLAVWRILRCAPWGGSGWDPVPAAPRHARRSAPEQHPADSGAQAFSEEGTPSTC